MPGVSEICIFHHDCHALSDCFHRYFSLHLSILFYESWLVVVCERIERLGRLGGQVDEAGHFSSLSWCSGWVLGTFCRLHARWQMGDGGVSIPPGP